MVKSRILRWTGYVARMEEGRSDFKILTSKSTGKILLRSSKLRRGEGVGINLKEIDVNAKNWIDRAQDMDYWRPLGGIHKLRHTLRGAEGSTKCDIV